MIRPVKECFPLKSTRASKNPKAGGGRACEKGEAVQNDHQPNDQTEEANAWHWLMEIQQSLVCSRASRPGVRTLLDIRSPAISLFSQFCLS